VWESVRKSFRRQKMWRYTVLRCAVVGFGGLLVAAALPLVSAPPASANPCTIVSDPSEDHHTVCVGKDVRAQDFTRKNLKWADFRGSNFEGMKLWFVDLRYAKLGPEPESHKKTNMRSVQFLGSYLSGADMTDAVLDGASIIDTSTGGAVFTGTQLMPPRLTKIPLEIIRQGTRIRLASVTEEMLAAQTQQLRMPRSGEESTKFGGCVEQKSGSAGSSQLETEKPMASFPPREKPYTLKCFVFGVWPFYDMEDREDAGVGYVDLVVREQQIPSRRGWG
jgi:hypothetical protein